MENRFDNTFLSLSNIVRTGYHILMSNAIALMKTCMYMLVNVCDCSQCIELRSVGLLSPNDYASQSSLRESLFECKERSQRPLSRH